MKVYKQRPKLIEIGPLTAAVSLPSEPRRRYGLKMTCDACGQLIKEDHFAGGFVKDHANLILHVACVPEGTRWLTRDEKPSDVDP